MDIYQAIMLGIVQGLTEFLPVSSSGHLVIGQSLFGLTEPALSFDISVHIGTLLAVIVLFRKDIMAIIASGVFFLKSLIRKNAATGRLKDNRELNMLWLIIIGSVPTAIIGILLNKIADRLFSSTLLVGIMLIITGIILWLTRKTSEKSKTGNKLTIGKALLIGLVQGMAVIPGISRSGSTIAAGLFAGLNRELSARFSFLLSIPAIAGAAVLNFADLQTASTISGAVTLIGAITSFVVGYLALTILLYFVKNGRLYVFAPYCVFVGIIAITLI